MAKPRYPDDIVLKAANVLVPFKERESITKFALRYHRLGIESTLDFLSPNERLEKGILVFPYPDEAGILWVTDRRVVYGPLEFRQYQFQDITSVQHFVKVRLLLFKFQVVTLFVPTTSAGGKVKRNDFECHSSYTQEQVADFVKWLSSYLKQVTSPQVLPSKSSSELIANLEKLIELHRLGHISDEELQRAKDKLLGT